MQVLQFLVLRPTPACPPGGTGVSVSADVEQAKCGAKIVSSGVESTFLGPRISWHLNHSKHIRKRGTVVWGHEKDEGSARERRSMCDARPFTPSGSSPSVVSLHAPLIPPLFGSCGFQAWPRHTASRRATFHPQMPPFAARTRPPPCRRSTGLPSPTR
jgi:hypothetical protein